jgi:hypothetical protein
MDPGLVVPHDQTSGGGAQKRVFSYGHVPLRELESSDQQSYSSVVNLLRQVGNNIIGNFIDEDFSGSGWYIQNVITFDGDRERDLLNSYLLEQGANFKRDLFGFSFDDDHVHVLHSCAFSSNQCKCRWRKALPVGKIKPGYRFRSNLREWRRNNWIAAIIYFYFQKGGAKEAWIKGKRQRLQTNRKYSRDFLSYIPVITMRNLYSTYS